PDIVAFWGVGAGVLEASAASVRVIGWPPRPQARLPPSRAAREAVASVWHIRCRTATSGPRRGLRSTGRGRRRRTPRLGAEPRRRRRCLSGPHGAATPPAVQPGHGGASPVLHRSRGSGG